MRLDDLKNIKNPIFYVTNDPSRAIGLEKHLPNFHIICLDDHPVVDLLIKDGVSVFCLEKEIKNRNTIFRNAGTILSHPKVISYIKEKAGKEKPWILFFKPLRKIELIAQKNQFELIGNSASINRNWEDKIIFGKFCLNNKLPIPQTVIDYLNNLEYRDLVNLLGNKFVIQFGRGWAGNSTFFVEDEGQFTEIKNIFGKIEVKASRFIEGITVLNNAVVFGDQTIVSPTAIQINSNPLLTSKKGGTGGRSWPSGISENQEKEIKDITIKVGKLMGLSGYKGFFGLDFLIEKKSGKVFLSENNARLTASSSFYTKLELKKGIFPLLGYHVLSFFGKSETEVPLRPKGIIGTEIIARNISPDPVISKGEIKTGMYKFPVEFILESPFLTDEKNADYWASSISRGRIVNPEIEILKIQSENKLINEDGGLSINTKQIVENFINQLELQKWTR